MTGGFGTDSVNILFRFSDTQFTFNPAFTDITGRHYLIGETFTNRVDGVEIYRFREVTINNADGNRLVDDLYYLANSDVARDGMDPLFHYRQFGWREGRDPNAYFDTDYYKQNNPDVLTDPLAHYAEFGWREGRDPSAAFDTSAYLSAYDDVAASGMDPLMHFLVWGRLDGHDAFAV